MASLPDSARYKELLIRRNRARNGAQAAQVIDQLADMLAPRRRISEVTSALEAVQSEVDVLRQEIAGVGGQLRAVEAAVSQAERPSEAFSAPAAKLSDAIGMIDFKVKSLEASLSALAAKPQKEVDLSGVQTEIARLANRPPAERTEVVEVPVAPSELKLSVVNRDKKGNIDTVKVEVIA